MLLDWLLAAQIFARFNVPLFRSPGPAQFTMTISPVLIGIALLHGTLINLLCFREGLDRLDPWPHIGERIKAIFWGTLILSLVLQLQTFSGLTAAAVWGAGLLHMCALCGWRWIEQNGRQHGLRSAQGVRNVLIVGAGTVGRRIANYLDKHPDMGRRVCGFLDDRKPIGDGVVGHTQDLAELARTGFVDELILSPPHDQAVTLRILHAARQLRLDVKMAPHLFGCEPEGKFESLGNIPLISLHREEFPVGELLLKRAFDMAVAGCALILLAPAFAIIGLLIRIDSEGPIFYKAPRAGLSKEGHSHVTNFAPWGGTPMV